MKTLTTSSLFAITVFACTLLPVRAATSITITNYSFESPAIASGDRNVAAGQGGLPGWTSWMSSTRFTNGVTDPSTLTFVNATQLYVIKSGISISNRTGDQYLFLEPGYQYSYTFIQQHTGSQFAEGTYTLSVDLGYATGFFDAKKNVNAELQFFYFNGGFDYGITNYTAIGSPTLISYTNLYSHDGSLVEYSMTLDTSNSSPWLGKDIAVRIVGFDQTTDYGQNLSIDNVRLDFEAIPEPSAVVLLASAAGLGVIARRRRPVRMTHSA